MVACRNLFMMKKFTFSGFFLNFEGKFVYKG